LLGKGGVCLMAHVRLYSLYKFVFVSLWVWWLRTVKESSPPSPTWFRSFQDYLHFWKNWMTAPVAGQWHNNEVVFSLGSVLRLF
jgi:hypothetical protein